MGLFQGMSHGFFVSATEYKTHNHQAQAAEVLQDNFRSKFEG